MKKETLKQHMEMLEIMKLIFANASPSTLQSIYGDYKIGTLFDGLKKIFTTELYLFSLPIVDINKIYEWIEYYRYFYPKRNGKIFNECNKLIGCLNNAKCYFEEFHNQSELQNFSPYNEKTMNFFYKAMVLDDEEICFYKISSSEVYEVWIIEYYLANYLLKGRLDYEEEVILLNSPKVELAIISLINSCIDTLTIDDRKLISKLMVDRLEGDNYKTIIENGKNIYQNPKELKDVILKIINFLKDYDKPKILEKDK